MIPSLNCGKIITGFNLKRYHQCRVKSDVICEGVRFVDSLKRERYRNFFFFYKLGEKFHILEIFIKTPMKSHVIRHRVQSQEWDDLRASYY